MTPLLRNAPTFLLLLATFWLAGGTASGATVAPTPFTATYRVAYRGLDAGLLHFRLGTDGEGRYVYETTAEPTMLARFLVGGDALERSVMRIDAEGVKPLSWFVDDGKRGRRQDGALEFDWELGEVRGTIKGERVVLPTEPGLQDRLSTQIAVMTALLRGEEPGVIPLIGDDEIKRYTYTRKGSGRMRTPAGEFATVLYEGTRPGSERVSRFWQAPAIGYIPVRVEQERRGRVETVMELVAVRRATDGPAAAAANR